MGKLTTHVLDTSHGCPGKGIKVRLYRKDKLLVSTKTNADGRCNAPLLAGKDMKAGTYRLEFDVAAYFKTKDTPFLGTVCVNFGIADAGEHYHVPLLVSPYGYSTYRGS